MQRLYLFVRVAARLSIGVLVLVLPWTPLWHENHLLSTAPHLVAFASSGVVRGIISGIGLLNLWIGISDAIHYHEG